MNPAHPPATVDDGLPREMALAVLVRLVQWRLDDMTHAPPHGGVADDQRAELVEALETLAVLVRETPASTG